MASDAALLRIAESFAAGLAQPLSPRICPFCFTLFMNTMVPKSHQALLLLTKCHVFWNALMAFICLDWTREQRETVRNILTRSAVLCNRCKPRGQPRCDVPGVPDAVNADGFADLFALVYQMICSCLHGSVINHVDGRKGFGSKRGRWPMSAEQLFPYGPEQSVHALVAQLGLYSFAESVITDIVSLHRPLAFPALLLYKTRTLLMDYVIARLRACPAAIERDISRLRQPVIPAVQDAIVQRHLGACYHTARMLYVVAVGPDHHDTDREYLFFLRERELFSALDAVAVLTDGRDGWSWLERLTTHLWHWMPEFERIAVGYPNPPPYARDVESRSSILADPYRALCFYLPRGIRPRGRECGGPDCGRTVHDKETPGAFSRCGKCRVAQYCSRDCQRADWTRACFPHKEICDMLRELLAFVAFDSSVIVDEFVSQCKEHAFPLEHVDKLICWATNGDVVTRYAAGGEATFKVPN